MEYVLAEWHRVSKKLNINLSINRVYIGQNEFSVRSTVSDFAPPHPGV